MDYIGERIALLNNESPEKLWAKAEQPQMPGMPPGAQPGQGAPQQLPPGMEQLSQQLLAGGQSPQPDLSLNTMANQ